MKENKKFNRIIIAILAVLGIVNAASYVWFRTETLTVFYTVIGFSALIAIMAFIQVIHQEYWHDYKPFNFWIGLGAAAAVIIVVCVFTLGILPKFNDVILPICMGFYPFIIPMIGAFLAMMWRTIRGNPIAGVLLVY